VNRSVSFIAKHLQTPGIMTVMDKYVKTVQFKTESYQSLFSEADPVC